MELINNTNKCAKSSLKADGRSFNFKESQLIKNSRYLNNKKDMRKKLIKTNIPNSRKNRILRKLYGGIIYNDFDINNSNENYIDTFSIFNIPKNISYNTENYDTDNLDTKEELNNENNKIIEDKPLISTFTDYSPKHSKGLDEFNKFYDEVEKDNPEAKNYRLFLTNIAKYESNFNSGIKNKNAPAYGYFLFMLDDNKYNNISNFAGTNIDTFLNNPKIQINAAVKLAKEFEKNFSKKDLELAEKLGITKNGLLGGAWLAGNGGVRKYLKGLGNPSDSHWGGKGTTVKDRINLFNFKIGGKL